MWRCFIFCILSGYSFKAEAQKYPRLDLKLGISQSFVSPRISEGDFFKISYPRVSPLPVFGLEYSKPVWKSKAIFFAGVSLDFQKFGSGMTFKNLSQFSGPNGQLQSGTGSIKFYAGIEKRFTQRQLRLNKNYFTWYAGLGFTYNLQKYSYPLGSTISGYGITYSGKQFIGGVYREFPYNSGQFEYISQIDFGRVHKFSPTLLSGGRWHIRNKKGINMLTLELQATYGITRYHNVSMAYTLDGLEKNDYLGEKGISIQLNFLIPLKNFGKRKKK